MKGGGLMKKKFTLLFIIIIFICSIILFQYNNNLKPLKSEEKKEIIRIEIPVGSSVEGIARLLEQKGVIKSSFAFSLYSKLNHIEDKYKAGIYDIDNSKAIKEIASELQHGKGFQEIIRFTIPEGFEVRMIVDKLVELGLGDRDKFYDVINNHYFDYDFLADISREEERLEGYLFPDTYEVYKNTSEEEIIDKMLERFNQIFNEEFKARASELNMSINEVVTLASIIEREAKVDEERKIVSSVFHNRLNINMMLRSCATVQYVLKERKEVLLYKDLEIQSPYNTYLNPGLPPGPIASPGLKSIEAALYPDDTDYLFFVAKNDGTHIFTKTFKEHLEAQNKLKSN